MDFRRIGKIKYKLANNIFYKPLNFSYIFIYNSWKYCECDKFLGCKPLDGKKSYCYICHITVAYHSSRIKNFKKISDIINNYLEIKEDIKLCVKFNPKINNFWLYHYKTSHKDHMGICRWIYLKDYFDSFLQLTKILNNREKII